MKQEKCVGCRACAEICAHGAPQFGEDGKVSIDISKCVGCVRCLAICSKDAIAARSDEAPAILNKKIAEYSKAVVAQPALVGSMLFDESCVCNEGDHFKRSYPNSDWKVCLEHAEKLGLGSRDDELVKI